MAVNISKTKYIIFHGRGKRVNMNDQNIVFNNNEIGKIQDPSLITPLERMYEAHPNKEFRSYKLLGVYLDECLTFKNHVNAICKKINQSIYCINRAKHFSLKKP